MNIKGLKMNNSEHVLFGMLKDRETLLLGLVHALINSGVLSVDTLLKEVVKLKAVKDQAQAKIKEEYYNNCGPYTKEFFKKGLL